MRQNAPLAAGKRLLTAVNQRRTGAEHGIGAQVVDRYEYCISMDLIHGLPNVGRRNDAILEEGTDDGTILGWKRFFHFP